MFYPDNFENKIGFDKIRDLLKERCLSPMGIQIADDIIFEDDLETISEELSVTNEFQLILKFEENFPSDNYFGFSDCLSKIRIEGTFPAVREVYDLKRSLETVRSILNFFKARDELRYPFLKKMCKPVKIYPYVLDSINRIIDDHGVIKDNASPRLKEIRTEIISKNSQVSKRLNAILKQAQADGIVDSDTSASVRNGRGVIPVSTYNKRKLKGLIHDQSSSGKTVFIEPEDIVEINNSIVELEYEEKERLSKS